MQRDNRESGYGKEMGKDKMSTLGLKLRKLECGMP